jgi:N-hydroxyarylamine O-acetyltransferase
VGGDGGVGGWSSTLDEAQVDEYLSRIDAGRPVRCDLDGLRTLQAAHLRTVPFENLSIHLGEPIVLSVPSLYDKIVGRHRGGFCYELNGLFADLLTTLGYRVDLLSARVYRTRSFGPPMDHLALRVDLGEPWLADVGFGRFAIAPLRLEERGEQPDPTGTFRIAPVAGDDGDGDLDVYMDGEPAYRLDPRPYELADFGPTCWWQQTSPESHFTRSLTCSLPTDSGRITLSGNRLVTTRGADRSIQTLATDDEVLEAYRKHFGIELSYPPTVRSKGGVANSSSQTKQI